MAKKPIDAKWNLGNPNDPAWDIFFPHEQQAKENLNHTGGRFSHYTSADSCLKILNNQEFWLRDTALMNDFNELRHADNCLRAAIQDESLVKRLNEVEHAMFGTKEQFTDRIEFAANQTSRKCFMMALSQHGGPNRQEEIYGRLSMWRAYGGTTNVAMIFNATHFLNSRCDEINVVPVIYGNESHIIQRLHVLADTMTDHFTELTNAGMKTVTSLFSIAIQSMSQSIKHIGFSEEAEWRLIHDEEILVGDAAYQRVETINGIPQTVSIARVKNTASNNPPIIDLKSALQKIIVGPTQYPDVIKEAITHELHRLGYPNAQGIVTVSDIPLRR